MSEKNDCYKCPHRGKVPGSAHSQCNFQNNEKESLRFLLAMRLAELRQTEIKDNDGETVVKLDPVGVANGWCMWPINFDPVWVDCYLPINQTNGTSTPAI